VLACGISACAAGLVGPAAGADPVTGTQTFDIAFGYDCSFPTEPGPATVRVTASAPVRARVGQLVRLTDASITVSMSPAVVADLGAITVGGTANLAVDGGAWLGSAPDAPVPAEGDLVLTVPVQVPEVTATKAGDLVLTAAELEISLAPKLGDGTPTDPPVVSLACVPAPGQDTVIGAIAVTGGWTSAPAPPPDDVPTDPDAPGVTPPVVIQGEVPAECHVITPPPGRLGAPLCAYLTGFANVAKLNAAVLQPPGIVNIAATTFQLNCKPGRLACQQAHVEPSFEGKPQLPPATSSFLPFGFVPTTGSMELTQLEPAFVDLVFTITFPRQGTAVAKARMVARVFDVEVDGVPLDVGDNCRTSEPMDVVLTADAANYSISEGGVLEGVVTIPPFSGCGTTENLDPVVSGLVSGPGNYIKMTQGNVCTITSGFRCPPDIPDPKR
jgi:hypothetical protein